MLLIILVMPLWLLYVYATAEESSEDTEEEKAEKRRDARDGFGGYKDRIDKWMEAADHHDSNFPDVMAALKHNQSSQCEVLAALTHFKKYIEDEIHSSQAEMLSMLKRMDERLTKMETKMG